MVRCALPRVVAALSLAAAGCGGGSTTPKLGWGAAQLIGGGTDSDRDVVSGMIPQLAMNATGSAFAVWQRSTAASSTIWVNHYDPSRGWGAAELVASGSDPALASDAAGNALLVWAGADRPPRLVQWRRFTPASGWGPATPVPIASDAAVAFSLAMTPGGDALLVWTSTSDVWASGLSAAGVWGAPVRIGSALDSGNVSAPQVVLDAGGDAAVVWVDWQAIAPFGSSTLRGAHFVAGSGWRDAQTLGGGHQVTAARLVGDLASDAAIVWVPISVVSGSPAFSRLTVADGWHDREAIGSLGAGMGPGQLAMGPNGTAVLALSPSAAPGAAANSVTILRFAPATSTWSAPVSLALGADQSVSSVDLDVGSAGDASVVWGEFGSATRGTVWAADVSAELKWGTPMPLHGAASALARCGPDLAYGGGYSPAVRLDASGRAVAVWAEFDCSRWSVWANALLPR